MFSKLLSAVVAVAVAALGGAEAGRSSAACPDYDSSKIKLVTFDCFAALMNLGG